MGSKPDVEIPPIALEPLPPERLTTLPEATTAPRQTRRKRPPGQLDKEVGARLRITRTASGLTLDDVAEQLDVAVATLRDVETGKVKITIGLLGQLLRLYDLKFGEFFAGLDEDETDRNAAARSYDYGLRIVDLVRKVDEPMTQRAMVSMIEAVARAADIAWRRAHTKPRATQGKAPWAKPKGGAEGEES